MTATALAWPQMARRLRDVSRRRRADFRSVWEALSLFSVHHDLRSALDETDWSGGLLSGSLAPAILAKNGAISGLVECLAGHFPILEDLTYEALASGAARVFPEPLGYQLHYDDLGDFYHHPESYFPEVGLAWLFWLDSETPLESQVEVWNRFRQKNGLETPFPQLILENQFLDWPGVAANLYDQDLLPFYTLVSAVLNDTGNFFLDADGLETVESFAIDAPTLRALESEYAEYRDLQQVLNGAVSQLRQNPAVLDRVLGAIVQNLYGWEGRS